MFDLVNELWEGFNSEKKLPIFVSCMQLEFLNCYKLVCIWPSLTVNCFRLSLYGLLKEMIKTNR